MNSGVTRVGPVGTGAVIAASMAVVALLVNCARRSSSGPESSFPVSPPRSPRSKKGIAFFTSPPRRCDSFFPFLALEHLEYRYGRFVTRDELSLIYIFTFTTTHTTFVIALIPWLPLQSCPIPQKMVRPCFSALNSRPISFARR